MTCFVLLKFLCQTINYADDKSRAKIDCDINVIKAELEVVSGVRSCYIVV